MKESVAVGGGIKRGKAVLQQQGWARGTDHLMSASRLPSVLPILCVCSCASFVLLLVVSHACWSRGASAPSYCGNDAGFSISNTSRNLRFLGERQVDSADEDSKETSLGRIIFGIGTSASSWKNRSEFVNLWWQQNYTRGFVWSDRDMGEDWKSTDPPYKVSEDISHFKYTHKTGHKSAIRISRIVSETFRLGLANVDWFVMGDDDTFFFTENLVRVLSKYDPKQLWYIGSNSEDHSQNQYFSYRMAYGGGGFAISYPLAELLAEKQDACLKRYTWLYGSDDRLKACISELGVPLTKEPGFHQFDVRGNVLGLLAAHPVAPIVSIHHLEAIHPLFFNHSRASAIAHLLKAAKLSPPNIFQQSICYDDKKEWSFSLSWGYMVHVYKGFVAPNMLEVPTLTFRSWNWRREAHAFPLNTRPKEAEICSEPSSFHMEDAKSLDEDGLIQTTYNNADRPNKLRRCQQKNYPLSLVKTVHVHSELVGREWIINPRRQCCRVTGIKEKSISIHVGTCRNGESLIGNDFVPLDAADIF